jgi:hypothetical protein
MSGTPAAFWADRAYDREYASDGVSRYGAYLRDARSSRQSTGSATAQGVAAAAVEVINTGSRGRKLPDSWRNE